MESTDTLARYAFRHEAEFAKGYLDDAGIESFLRVDDAGGNLGLALEGGAEIVVRREDLPRAREVLAEAGLLEE